jgi:transcriptional regulator with GAF, ATPase, and Fis domain
MEVRERNYLDEPIMWSGSADPEYPYETVFDGRRLKVKVNDFPEEHFYTLLVDADPVASFDKWPDRWVRDGEEGSPKVDSDAARNVASTDPINKSSRHLIPPFNPQENLRQSANSFLNDSDYYSTYERTSNVNSQGSLREPVARSGKEHFAPRLIAINGSLKGSTFTLNADDVSIGRESASVVCLSHSSVSRRHCVIKRRGTEFVICDLDSYNGTFVNGVPVKEQTLTHADQIKVGSIALLFLVGESEDAITANLVQLDDSNPVTQSTRQMHPQTLLHNTEQVLLQSPAHERVARDLGVLLKIGCRINLLRHTQELQREILNSIFEVVPVDRGAILLSQGEQEFSSLYGRDREDENKPVHISRTVVDKVMAEAVAILSNDIRTSEMFSAAQSLMVAQITSLMCVPLIVFEKVVGVIYLDTSDPMVRFDEGHLQLLAGIAGIAAVSLENARLMEWLEGENNRLRSSLAIEHSMVGESAAMRGVYHFIERVAPTKSAVLICGESGTGKELAAHAIHANSPRAVKPFVVINCAALPETLLESELFGHERGAFTGAIALKKGKLEVAHGGTVFLDEIGELAPALQSRLLRFLQDHKIERLGSTRSIELDVRVVAATNRNLEEAIADGLFRADLYHRLNVVKVTMPPLRERRADIALLASYFTAKYSKACKRTVNGISPAARSLLQGYEWPGNVRELENAIERAIVLGSADVIEPDDLPERLLESASVSKLPMAKYYEAIKQAKRELILNALEQAKGNYTEAANALGVHPNNLHRLIRTLDLRAAIGK